MKNETEKLKKIIQNLTNIINHFVNDCDEETFLKGIKEKLNNEQFPETVFFDTPNDKPIVEKEVKAKRIKKITLTKPL